VIVVGTVLYGDHGLLAQRLFRSLGEGWYDLVNIGFNTVTAEALDAAYAFAAKAKVPVMGWFPTTNAAKYPLLRCFIFGREGRPGVGDPPPLFPDDWYVHFDDDSYITSRAAFPEIFPPGKDAVGSWYELDFKRDERLLIPEQPWYAGVPWHWSTKKKRQRLFFPTGGFWGCRVDFLQRWNFPFPELCHSGGDALFGELLRQQNARTLELVDGDPVAINRSATRGVEDKTIDRFRYLVDRNRVYTTDHQRFEVTAKLLNPQRDPYERSRSFQI
jgi:hypothetical protein